MAKTPTNVTRRKQISNGKKVAVNATKNKVESVTKLHKLGPKKPTKVK